jgi:hypothetical protein
VDAPLANTYGYVLMTADRPRPEHLEFEERFEEFRKAG